jgi:hypothetical protein
MVQYTGSDVKTICRNNHFATRIWTDSDLNLRLVASGLLALWQTNVSYRMGILQIYGDTNGDRIALLHPATFGSVVKIKEFIQPCVARLSLQLMERVGCRSVRFFHVNVEVLHHLLAYRAVFPLVSIGNKSMTRPVLQYQIYPFKQKLTRRRC